MPAIAGLSVVGLVTLGSAAYATSQFQQQLHLDGVPVDLGFQSAAPCFPGLDIVIQGNAHEHTQVNPNGDVWVNDTVEGQVSLVDTSGNPLAEQGTYPPGVLVATGGHGEAWFGLEQNNQVANMHFKDDLFINGVRIQQNGQFTVDKYGNPHVTNVRTTCG